MAENPVHPTRRHTFRKSRSPTSSFLLQHPTSLSSPNSPINHEDHHSSLSRGRQLWNMAVETVLEPEKTSPASLSMVSSTGGNDPNGWYNLTNR